MPLELEDQPRVIFERNPLKVVVAQVRFPPIFSLEHPGGVAVLQDAIRSEFPMAEPRGQQVTVSISPAGLGAPSGQPGPWRFHSADGQWIAAVAPDFVSLETTAYERFETFRDRARSLFQAAASTLSIARRERLGLRYVDEITHPEAVLVADWHKFLHPELIGVAGGEQLKDHVVQALQQISLELGEGKMAIRHGYVRQAQAGSTYVLDIDAYDDSPGVFDADGIIEQMTLFKRWCWNFFRKSITDELAAYLRPKQIHG